MSDYADNINTIDYRQMETVTVTNVTEQDKHDIPIMFVLNENNFNFSTARADGLDLRLCVSSNGSGVLQMWIASWSQDLRRAVVWFKLPRLLPSEVKTLYAFWGNAYDTGISDINTMRAGIQREFGEDVCTGGTATAGAAPGTGSVPGLGNPDYAFDNSYSSYMPFRFAPIYDIRLPCWLTYDFGPGVTKQIESVKIAVPNSFYPKNMIIQGSNDNINWDDLDSMTFPQDVADGLSEYTRIFYNSTAYRYIRIYVVDSWSGSYVYIYEVEMFEVISVVEVSGVGFLLADDFDDAELDSSLWVAVAGTPTIADSKIRLPTNGYIESIDVISDTDSWILYEGFGYWSGNPNPNTRLHGINFYGGENEFRAEWMMTTPRYHNFEYGGGLVRDDGDGYRGFENHSSQLNYVAYNEDTDFIYQGMLNRVSFPDYNDSWERKVHRNTDIGRVRLVGGQVSNTPSIDWIVIKEYSPTTEPIVDLSNLWIPYEDIPHQALDFTDYTTDITSVDFYHSSDCGGDPYRLSDNIANSLANIFVADDLADGGSESPRDEYVTVYRITGAYNQSTGQWNDKNVRYRFYAENLDNIVGNGLKLTFGNMNPITSCYLGYPADTGDLWDFDGNQKRVTVGGQGAFEVSSQEVETDLINMYYDGTSDLVLSMYVPSAWSWSKYGGPDNSYVWGKGGASEAHLTDVTGYTNVYPDTDQAAWFINKIRTRINFNVAGGGSIIIDFGRGRENIADNDYLHLDSDHVEFYGAAKLSDRETDVYGANYWHATTTSGWAAIRFPSATAVGCISVQAVADNLDGMIQDYEIYGTALDPRFSLESEWTLLAEGNFEQIIQEQPVYFNRGRFYYYILKVLNTYGDNIALQEWKFYEAKASLRKRAVSQFRLLPVVLLGQEDYFPKHVEFYGSDDGIIWDVLKGSTETYTPFYDATYGRWQRYSLENYKAYYMYKLTIRDNWYAAADEIKIAEWEMVEKVSEAYNYRILNGTTNEINQIWADPTTTFDDGNVYILNDVLNVVYDDDDDTAVYTTVSGVIADMNVIV